MNKDQSAQLKVLLIEMFGWFHDFCEANHLRYYALGGTMLGAARHQGFIPWDDDIDVGMPREDYLRMEQLMQNVSGRYVLETPNTKNADFFYPFSKLYDTQTTLVENTRCKIKRGIYLDIFPLDGAGKTETEAVTYFKQVKARRNLLLTMTTGIRRGRSFFKNVAVCIMRCVPDCVLSRKKALLSLDQLCRFRNFDQCDWGGNLMGNWMEREIMPRSVMGMPTAYKFESLMIWGPQDYDGYLTRLYGCWQELPPIEKRKSHHDYLHCDLFHSYLDESERKSITK